MPENTITLNLPTIAIVGRPNVGKSTLFNTLTKTKDALVSDFPGLTRDRNYGIGQVGEMPYIIIDTGGLISDNDAQEILNKKTNQQAWQAITYADIVLFVVDARAGINSLDREIAEKLRKANRNIFLVANKIEGLDANSISAEFYELGLGQVWPIAARQNVKITPLVNAFLDNILERNPELEVLKNQHTEDTTEDNSIKVALVGRPNVGKSTLINRLIGEERMVVSDIAGTTRDTISTHIERRGQKYTLLDTAGVRRKSKTKEKIEKFSILKTLQAIERSNVVLLIIDAQENLTHQDLELLRFVVEAGKALVIAVNKWDNLETEQRNIIKNDLSYRLAFVDFAKVHFISALHGTGVGNLFSSIKKAYISATKDLATHNLTDILAAALANYQPPLINGKRLKLRYAHAGGKNPPVIVIHGNNLTVPINYQKYLQKFFRKDLKLNGTPLRLVFKKSSNPYQTK